MEAGDAPQRWLLLLPKPPREGSYSKALSHSLLEASHDSSQSNTATVLFIGFPYTLPKEAFSRTQVYDALQKQYATLYQEVCILITQHAIDVENDNDVDVRVFAFSDPSLSRIYDPDTPVKAGLATLQSIASLHRKWDKIQAVDDQEGAVLITRYLNVARSSVNFTDLSIEKLPGDFEPIEQSTTASPDAAQYHYSVAVGGTFDHLHVGHKLLLTMSALRLEPSAPIKLDTGAISRALTIGITSDDLLKEKKYREELQGWDTRVASVRKFVQSLQELEAPSNLPRSTASSIDESLNGRTLSDIFDNGLVVKYTEIYDPFGPTITEESISALVISGETRAGGKAVNDRRQEKGWAPVELYEVDVLDAEETQDGASLKGQEDFKSKISSTDIRRRIHQKKERQETFESRRSDVGDLQDW